VLPPSHPLAPSPYPSQSLLTLLLTLPPYGTNPPHTHNGAAVTDLVLKGAVLNQMNDEEEGRVYREGES